MKVLMNLSLQSVLLASLAMSVSAYSQGVPFGSGSSDGCYNQINSMSPKYNVDIEKLKASLQSPGKLNDEKPDTEKTVAEKPAASVQQAASGNQATNTQTPQSSGYKYQSIHVRLSSGYKFQASHN